MEEKAAITSVPPGNATNWILPKFVIKIAEELQPPLPPPLFPYCCLSLPDIHGRGKAAAASPAVHIPSRSPETASTIPQMMDPQ